jgi:hypothetical protein
MVNDTWVVPDPAAILVGSAGCPVLKTQAAVESGSPEQLSCTSAVNVDAETGVAVKLYASVVCPANTASDPPPAHVKFGGAVTVKENVVVLVAAGALVAPCTVTVDVP